MEALEAKKKNFVYAVALLTNTPPVKIETENHLHNCAADEEDVLQEIWKLFTIHGKIIILENRGIEVQNNQRCKGVHHWGNQKRDRSY